MPHVTPCPAGFKSAAHYLVLNNLAPLPVDAAAEGSAEPLSAAANETAAAGDALASEAAAAAAGGAAEEVAALPEAEGEQPPNSPLSRSQRSRASSIPFMT